MNYNSVHLMRVLPITAGIGIMLFILLTKAGLNEDYTIIISLIYTIVHTLNMIEVEMLREELSEFKNKVK